MPRYEFKIAETRLRTIVVEVESADKALQLPDAWYSSSLAEKLGKVGGWSFHVRDMKELTDLPCDVVDCPACLGAGKYDLVSYSTIAEEQLEYTAFCANCQGAGVVLKVKVRSPGDASHQDQPDSLVSEV